MSMNENNVARGTSAGAGGVGFVELEIDLPSDLYATIEALAERDGVTVDDKLAYLLSESVRTPRASRCKDRPGSKNVSKR